MSIPTTFPDSILNKVPSVEIPRKNSWPNPPFQKLSPPKCGPDSRVYPDDCECKFMCENYFMKFTQVFGQVNAGINIIEDAAAQLDELHGTLFGGVKNILTRNPIVLPTMNFTDDVMESITSVTSVYTNPLERIIEILNGQGISESCGWMSCAFKALRDLFNFPTVPSIADVGEDAVRDAIKGIEDAANNAIDQANEKILGLQRGVAEGLLDKMTDLGLDRVGLFTEQANKAFNIVGLTPAIRGTMDEFANCIVQSCNRTSCRYRKTFKDYIIGPQELMNELALNPLIGLTEGTADFMDGVLKKKRALNDMLQHGMSDLLDRLIPDPAICDEDLPERNLNFTPAAGPNGEVPSVTQGKPENYLDDPAVQPPVSPNSNGYGVLIGKDWAVNVVFIAQTVDTIEIRVSGGPNGSLPEVFEGPKLIIELSAETAQDVVALLNSITVSNGQRFAATVGRSGALELGVVTTLEYHRDVVGVEHTSRPTEPVYRTTELDIGGISVHFTTVAPKDSTKIYPVEKLRVELTGSPNLPARLVSDTVDGDVIFRYVLEPKIRLKTLIREVNREGKFYAESAEFYNPETVLSVESSGEFVDVAESDRQPYQIPKTTAEITEVPTTAPPAELGDYPGEAYDVDGNQVQ